MQINKLFWANSKVPAAYLSQETIGFLKEQELDNRDAKQQKLVCSFRESIRKRFPLINFECLSDEEESWIRKYARRRSSEDPIRTLFLIDSVGLEPDKSLEVKLRWHAKNQHVHPSTELFDHSRQAMESIDGLVEYWRDAPQNELSEKSTADDIADLLLLIMIKKLISDPELAFTYMFALIFCSVAFRRGQVAAYLDEELKPIPRDQLVGHKLKSTRKVLADRETLHLLNRLV